MPEYAILKQPISGKFDAGIAYQIAKAVSAKVEAVSVATHTEPWLILVRCTEELSADEKRQVEDAIQKAS